MTCYAKRTCESVAHSAGGYTLVELIVALGLFAFVMTLASGAYLLMIGANRRAQALATGIDNLSFALESMTRAIRTGTGYDCNGLGDCSGGASSFSFKDSAGASVTYALSTQAGTLGTVGDIARNGVPVTSPALNVTGLSFVADGTSKADTLQARVLIVVSGTVSIGPGSTEPFTVETLAVMRGSDI